MTKIIIVVLLLIGLSFQAAPAQASSDEAAKLFSINCAACHAGGGNRVVAAKSLKLSALEKYSMNSEDAIAYQVTKGKNAMPAFGKKLSEEKIRDVANYVLEQAANNWGKA